jgi:transposase
MMGIKDRCFKTHPHLNLDDLVPANNFYRDLERKVDLSFVRDWVAPFYTARGRPSIDPVVFFKLQLIMLFEDIRSERLLMEQAHLQLAWRWYVGYDLDEALPDHSSLTKIRERYGLAIFRQFFEHIVGLCVEAGLVWGKELYFDGTRVQANADLFSNVPNFEYQLRNHLNILFPSEDPARLPRSLPRPKPDFMEKWIETYQAKAPRLRLSDTAYQSLATRRTSLSDAEATPIRGKKEIGYHTHYMVDGGLNRIILGVLVTPADVLDHTPMLDLVRWGRFRWKIHPHIAVGDSRYGTVENIVGLLGHGILPYTLRAEFRKSSKYPYEAFRYDPQRDIYYCPQGHPLKRGALDRDHQTIIYQASVLDCCPCPVRQHCTTAQGKGRRISRSYFQAAVDFARNTPLCQGFTQTVSLG